MTHKILKALGKAITYTIGSLIFIAITVIVFAIAFKLALLAFSTDVAFIIGLVAILFYLIFIYVLLEG